MKHPLRDWRKLGECHKVIQHSPGGGDYSAITVNSEGLLAVTEEANRCVHLLTNEGALVKSIDKGVIDDRGLLSGLFSGAEYVFGGMRYPSLPSVAFDLKGDFWVITCNDERVGVKLSIGGRLLQTIRYTPGVAFSFPSSMSVSQEGLIYVCHCADHCVAVYNEKGKFLFTFGSKGSGPGRFDGPLDIAFGSDGLMYVSDNGNRRVCVWSEVGTFKRAFQTKDVPSHIAATSDNHLLITSYSSNIVMVYTLEGELVHEFGSEGSHPGRFNGPKGICVDDNGVVYVVDKGNKRVQVF